jgi:hypothetical protein
VSSPAR